MILGDQILMILSDFRGPGAHSGGLGAHFEDTAFFCDFGDTAAAKKTSLFEVRMRPRTHFLQCCFSLFFECPFLSILCDLECPETSFWEAFGITFPAEARNQKSVFGLHRRVRIAYPAFWKMHFSATFSILVFGALRRKSFWLDFASRDQRIAARLDAGVSMEED